MKKLLSFTITAVTAFAIMMTPVTSSFALPIFKCYGLAACKGKPGCYKRRGAALCKAQGGTRTKPTTESTPETY